MRNIYCRVTILLGQIQSKVSGRKKRLDHENQVQCHGLQKNPNINADVVYEENLTAGLETDL